MARLNHDKSPKIACYKCRQLGHWAALCPEDPRASRSSIKPSLTMAQQDWSSPLKPAHQSQITIMGLKPRCNWIWQLGPRISWLTQATYSVLTSYCGAFSSQTCTILSAIGTTITKRFTLLLGWANIFPSVSSGPWLSSTLIVKKSLHAFEILQLLQFWKKML